MNSVTLLYAFMFATFFFDMYKWLIFIVSSEKLEKSLYDSDNHEDGGVPVKI